MTMKKNQTGNIEDFLGSVLRGAAKILGCGTANLLIFNTRTDEIYIRVGSIADKIIRLKEIEAILGNTLQKAVFSLSGAADSLVYQSWNDQALCETSSVSELASGVFPQDVVDTMSMMLTDLRFICVPVICRKRALGVIIFTKEDTHPFGRQQREILLQYAQRIGEIIDNEYRSRGASVAAKSSLMPGNTTYAQLIFDDQGNLSGQSKLTSGGDDQAANPLYELTNAIPVLAKEAVRLCSLHPSNDETETLLLPEQPFSKTDVDAGAKFRAELSKIIVHDETFVLCNLFNLDKKTGKSMQSQLIHLALGDAAPAVIVDSSFLIASCNETTEQLTGYTAEELLQKPIDILFQKSKNIRAILDHQFLFFSNGHFEEDTVIRHKDGSLFESKVEALLLVDEKNEGIGFLVLIRKQSTSQQDDDSEDNITALMRRERLATMGEMAAGLAHEIRNPLVSIGATLEMLSKETIGTEETGAILGDLVQEVNRIDMILKEYLSLSVRQNTSVTRVHLDTLVSDSIQILEGAKPADDIVVIKDIDSRFDVFGDYIGLRQVIINLLKNAIDATPKGKNVRCHAKQDTGEVQIFIDDEGRGLLFDAKECFRPFFTSKKNGTGLGLAVCKKILAAHGGTIYLENREAGGCRASITLPRGFEIDGNTEPDSQ